MLCVARRARGLDAAVRAQTEPGGFGGPRRLLRRRGVAKCVPRNSGRFQSCSHFGQFQLLAQCVASQKTLRRPKPCTCVNQSLTPNVEFYIDRRRRRPPDGCFSRASRGEWLVCSFLPFMFRSIFLLAGSASAWRAALDGDGGGGGVPFRRLLSSRFSQQLSKESV